MVDGYFVLEVRICLVVDWDFLDEIGLFEEKKNSIVWVISRAVEFYFDFPSFIFGHHTPILQQFIRLDFVLLRQHYVY